MNTYAHIFVAGTFDTLHKGHEAVLRAAFQHGATVTIGITSDAYIHTYKKSPVVQSFAKRSEFVHQWIQNQSFDHPFTIVEIHDPYEPAVSGPYDSLIVTEQNRTTGELINKQRKQHGLPPLMLVMIPLVPSYDGAPISSTRVRSEEIDRNGNLYLPESLRISLKHPLGKIIIPEDFPKHIAGTMVITVGDVTTDALLSQGIVPDLSIIDLHVKRKPYKQLKEFPFLENIHIVRVSSGPGYISQEAMRAITSWEHSGKKTVLLVKGEDDLLVLPAILSAPLSGIICYGQPNVGLVMATVTDQLKIEARTYLKQFIRS